MSGPIKLKRLQACHPSLNVERVMMLKALYRGGKSLLGDGAIMNRVFPSYTYESANVYEERKSRAFYENMFALVVNQVSAGLAQDPLRWRQAAPGVESEETPPIEDPYWLDLLKNATALSDDGSSTRSLDQVMRDVAVEALVTGWGWTQSELPAPDDEFPPSTLAEQEASGALRAYLVPWPTECVTDWCEKAGHLLWVRTYQTETPSDDPAMDRDSTRHVWTIWERDSKTIYELVQNKEKQQLPGLETLIAPLREEKHSFGRVPWTRLDLTARAGTHLHVGDAIESLCRSYFNRQNGESFQWTQFCFQQLYEFLGPEVPGVDTMISESQTDPSRARRRRAPGVVHVRGKDDRAEFVGPQMDGAEAGRNALQDARDAILRVTAQMALAQDTSGAMLRRSADSKRQDSVAQEIVLGAIGKRLIVAARSSVALLAAGRGDSEPPPEPQGYERFNTTDSETLANEDLVLESINIPSARFQIERKYQLAAARLGDNASAEHLEEIREQLEAGITQDQFVMPTPMEQAQMDAGISPEQLDAEAALAEGEGTSQGTLQGTPQLDENGDPMLDDQGQPVMDDAAAPTDVKAADTAFNGAQVKALVDLMISVANEELPPDAALQIVLVAFPEVTPEQAKKMIDTLRNFKPKPKPAPVIAGHGPPPPGSPPPGAKGTPPPGVIKTPGAPP